MTRPDAAGLTADQQAALTAMHDAVVAAGKACGVQDVTAWNEAATLYGAWKAFARTRARFPTFDLGGRDVSPPEAGMYLLDVPVDRFRVVAEPDFVMVYAEGHPPLALTHAQVLILWGTSLVRRSLAGDPADPPPEPVEDGDG